MTGKDETSTNPQWLICAKVTLQGFLIQADSFPEPRGYHQAGAFTRFVRHQWREPHSYIQSQWITGWLLQWSQVLSYSRVNYSSQGWKAAVSKISATNDAYSLLQWKDKHRLPVHQDDSLSAALLVPCQGSWDRLYSLQPEVNNNNNNDILIKREPLVYARARHTVQKKNKSFRLGGYKLKKENKKQQLDNSNHKLIYGHCTSR